MLYLLCQEGEGRGGDGRRGLRVSSAQPLCGPNGRAVANLRLQTLERRLQAPGGFKTCITPQSGDGILRIFGGGIAHAFVSM